MSLLTIISLIAFCIISGVIWECSIYFNFDLFKFYSENLRSALFSGFLTIGAFLLSLKTFIIVKLKEDLYDQDEYRARYEKNRTLNKKKAGTIYAPLNRLSDFLIICVIGSLVSAGFHFSIGLFKYNLTAAICISSSLFSLIIVLVACWEVKKNLAIMFELLEEKEIAYYRKKDQESSSD